MINENTGNITKEIKSHRNIPKRIPIKERLEIQGVLYEKNKISYKNKKSELLNTQIATNKLNKLNFLAFHIFLCKMVHSKY